MKNETNAAFHYLFTPFSIVSSTNVDASCTKVLALALENPEIAEDSESEDRRDWSKEEGTTIRGPFGFEFVFFFVFFSRWICIGIFVGIEIWYFVCVCVFWNVTFYTTTEYEYEMFRKIK